jgi:hypothetical protein
MNTRQTATLAYDPPDSGMASLALVPLVVVFLLVVSYPMYAAVGGGGVLTGLAVATVGRWLSGRLPRPGRSHPRV